MQKKPSKELLPSLVTRGKAIGLEWLKKLEELQEFFFSSTSLSQELASRYPLL